MKTALSARSALRPLALATLVAGSALLSACAPILLGGAAVGSMLFVSDRRTAGAQVEDQAIESKAARQIKTVLNDHGHVNVNSYNRVVLLTGEVPSEAERLAIEQAVSGVENVRSVVNETAVMTATSMSERSNDLLVASKVHATFLDAGDFQGNSFKVVTERGTVFLLGRVTATELERATAMARGISGVKRVVRAVELVTDEELKGLQPAVTPSNQPPSPSRR